MELGLQEGIVCKAQSSRRTVREALSRRVFERKSCVSLFSANSFSLQTSPSFPTISSKACSLVSLVVQTISAFRQIFCFLPIFSISINVLPETSRDFAHFSPSNIKPDPLAIYNIDPFIASLA
jgi:hypothetical protein